MSKSSIAISLMSRVTVLGLALLLAIFAPPEADAKNPLSLDLKNSHSHEHVLLKPYMISLRKRIQAAWLNGQSNTGDELECEVRFIVGMNGEIMNVAVTESSGNDSFDQSAINAVHIISPFSPSPVGRILVIVGSFEGYAPKEWIPQLPPQRQATFNNQQSEPPTQQPPMIRQSWENQFAESADEGSANTQVQDESHERSNEFNSTGPQTSTRFPQNPPNLAKLKTVQPAQRKAVHPKHRQKSFESHRSAMKSGKPDHTKFRKQLKLTSKEDPTKKAGERITPPPIMDLPPKQ